MLLPTDVSRPWRLLRPSKGADGLLRPIPPVRCTCAGNAIHCPLSAIDEIENNSSRGTNVYPQSCDMLGTPFRLFPSRKTIERTTTPGQRLGPTRRRHPPPTDWLLGGE